MKKAKYPVSLLVMFIVGLTTCRMDMGLGPSVDLEGPSLSISSPANRDFVNSVFDITGICSDNVNVTRVVAEDIDTRLIYPAEITGGTWRIHIDMPTDKFSPGSVEKTFRITAYDAAGNTSNLSVAQITLRVDLTPPFLEELAITRPTGARIDAQELPVLKDMDREDMSNINYFQNEAFRVSGRVDDDFTIAEEYLVLQHESGDTKKFRFEFNNVPDSYQPRWDITAADLTEWNSAYAEGTHYFRLAVEATDDSGKTLTNYREWLCWQPAADKAHASISSAKDGLLSVSEGESVQINVFDDDYLEQAYAYLITASVWQQQKTARGFNDEELGNALAADTALREALMPGANLIDTLPAFTTLELKNLKDYGVNDPGEYRLVVLIKDSKPGVIESNPGVWSAKVFIAVVVNAAAPIIVINNPQENTVPAISAGKFTLDGYIIDRYQISSLRIAWIPDGSPGSSAEKTGWAKTALTNNAAPALGQPGYGIQIRDIPFGPPSDYEIGGIAYQKYNFAREFDILRDFMWDADSDGESETRENALRAFVILAENPSGPYFQNYRVLGNSEPPVITVIDPEQETKFHSTAADLNFEFTVAIPGGLEAELSVTEGGNTYTPLRGADGVYRFTVPKASFAGKEGQTLTYLIKAEDALGNRSSVSRNIIPSDLPILLRITSGMPSGTVKYNDPLTIQAVFSDPVRVQGAPKILLRYSASDTTDKYAIYESGANSTVLTFSFDWTGQDGAESDLLRSSRTPLWTDTSNYIWVTKDNSEAKVPTDAAFLAEADSLHSQKAFKIDAKAPSITGAGIVDNTSGFPAKNTDSYYMQSAELYIALSLSEAVRVEGTPKLALSNLLINNAAPAGDAGKAEYLRLDTSGGRTRLIFRYTVPAGAMADPVKVTVSSAFSAEDKAFITDTAGNPLSLVGGVIDTNAFIDTQKPAAPGFTLNGSSPLSPALYNAAPYITLTGYETGARAEYSVNGGLSWTAMNNPLSGQETSFDKIGGGSHLFTVRQTDRAGNISENPAAIPITVNIEFPAIVDVGCLQPDGTYPDKAALRFKVSFSDKVRATAAGAAVTLAAGSQGGGGTAAVVAPGPSSALSTSLYFDWTVEAGKVMDPVKISKIDLSNVEDSYGNRLTEAAKIITITGVPAADGFPVLEGRAGLKVDSVRPAVSGYTPGEGATITKFEGDKPVVTLTFNEPVLPESGYITLRPYGEWLIPPVMSEAEFQSVYYALDSDGQNTLMIGSGGSPLLNDNGQPVGPYKKITQGLKEGTGKWVPDTATKYVLAYNLDLTGTGQLGNYTVNRQTIPSTTTPNDLRDVFNRAKYLWQQFEVTDAKVTPVSASGSAAGGYTQYKLVFDEPPYGRWEGRQWEVLIDEGAFHDAAGNTNAKVGTLEPGDAAAATDYYFWSPGTAAPVIRIDRYSNDAVWQTGSPSQAAMRPKIEVRIDTETPGAKIQYGILNKSSSTANWSTMTTSSKSTNADADIAELTGLTLLSGVHDSGVKITDIGDDSIMTARKDYVAAEASRSGDFLADVSERGYEGVFKTAVFFRGRSNSELKQPGAAGDIGSGSTGIPVIQGNSQVTGISVISGFPLKDNPVGYVGGDSTTEFQMFSKHMYLAQAGNAANNRYWAWITWEIVTDWWQISCISSLSGTRHFQQTGDSGSQYTQGSYGNFIYRFQQDGYN